MSIIISLRQHKFLRRIWLQYSTRSMVATAHTHFLLSHVNLSAHRNHFIKRPFDWNIEACTTLELCVWSSLKAHLNYAMHLVDWIDACSPMANARWLNSQLRTKKWFTRACIRGLLHLIPMFSIVLLFICVFFSFCCGAQFYQCKWPYTHVCRNVKWIQHSPLLDTLPFHWFKYRSACWTWHNFACHHHISLCCECATFGRNQRNFLNHKFQVNVRKSEAKEMSVYKTKHEHLHGPYLPCEKLHVPQIHCVDNGAIRFRNRQILTECERITKKKGQYGRCVCVFSAGTSKSHRFFSL